MPHFKSIIFYLNSFKIKLFLQKIQNFRVLGAPPLDLQNSPLPPLRISGYTPNNIAFGRFICKRDLITRVFTLFDCCDEILQVYRK